MTERNYTHKIVMFDVNSAKRVASFKSLENAIMFKKSIDFNKKSRFKKDDANMMFNVDNIVQINPVEVIRGGNPMHLDECLELTKKYSKCPKCGSNKIGGGEGGLLVEDLTFDRWCKCGWKVQVKYKKVIKE